MGRNENVEIFEDTRRLCQTNPELVGAIRESNSRQEVIFEADCVSAAPRFSEPAKIVVSKKQRTNKRTS